MRGYSVVRICPFLWLCETTPSFRHLREDVWFSSERTLACEARGPRFESGYVRCGLESAWSNSAKTSP